MQRVSRSFSHPPAAAAEALFRRFKTRDPFLIAKHLGITVILLDTLTHLRGFFRVIRQNAYLFINAALSPEERRVVCAHELGHARLHKADTPSLRISDGGRGKQELEANLFAAALLIPAEELRPLLLEEKSAREAAAVLGVDENLVALRVKMLSSKDRAARIPDYDPLFLATAPAPDTEL